MKVFAVFSVILIASCAQETAENFKFNWNIIESNANEWKSKETRITGGSIAAPHEFPYQIGLYMQLKPQYEGQVGRLHTWCGASLISEKFVITAAHCLSRIEAAIVFVGAHNIKANESDRQLIPVYPTNWIIHPEYDSISRNDIAIINLPKPVTLNEKVQPIRLPRRSQNQQKIEGRLATTSGWGQTSDKGPTSDVLRYANLKILPNSVCQIFYSIWFLKTNICVDGSKQISVCPGDSGGPLVITELDGSKTLVGLTSFGRLEGCKVGYPTAFTRISSYLDWISSITNISIEN